VQARTMACGSVDTTRADCIYNLVFREQSRRGHNVLRKLSAKTLIKSYKIFTLKLRFHRILRIFPDFRLQIASVCEPEVMIGAHITNCVAPSLFGASH
jgi:hypothetical protein